MVGDYYTGSISESQLTETVLYFIPMGRKRVFHARLGLKLTFDIGL